jgi:hypothetical protein
MSRSSADVASSNSMTLGRMASARAMATCCCWPPESRGTRALFREPHLVQELACASLASALAAGRGGLIATFCKAVRWGNRLKR